MTPETPEPGDAGWEAHRLEQLEGWLAATPAQRLAWLEEAIAFAHRVGALLPEPRSGTGEGSERP